MPREWRQRVEDALDAIERIDAFLKNHDAAAFRADRRSIDAVAYNLLVVGETAARMPEEVVLAHAEIPWMKMRAIRNIVAHQYFDVSPEVLWRSATEDLPVLAGLLRRLLDSAWPA